MGAQHDAPVTRIPVAEAEQTLVAVQKDALLIAERADDHLARLLIEAVPDAKRLVVAVVRQSGPRADASLLVLEMGRDEKLAVDFVVADGERRRGVLFRVDLLERSRGRRHG